MSLRAVLIALALIASACGSSTEEATVPDDTVADDVAEQTDDAQTDEIETDDSEVADAADEGDIDTAEPVDEPDTDVAEETTEATDDSGEERGLIGPPDTLDPDCSAVPSASVGLQTGTVTTAGFEYNFQFVVPSSYDGTAPLPVVLDFHGLGSNGAQQALLSGVAALAEGEGFLAVEPTGVPAVGEDRNSWELPQFDEPVRDDVAMVVDLIDLLATTVCIDQGRIYSIGMSNGGLFTSELVCDLSERLAAAVSVAGVTHDDSCAPTRAVPYLAFHGIDDTTVPFNGGGESSLGASPFFEQVMPEEFSQFADDFGCTGSEDTSITTEITLTSYEGCDNDIEMGFYAIAGAGHTWPGSLVSASIASLGVTNTDIDATQTAWEFFQENSLPGAIEIAATEIEADAEEADTE